MYFIDSKFNDSQAEKREIEPLKREMTKKEPRKTAVPDIFPRRSKSKLAWTKPALWEKSKEEKKNLKNTLLKKDQGVQRREKIAKV